MQNIKTYFNFVNSSLRSNCYSEGELVINVGGGVLGNIVSLAAQVACFLILQQVPFLKKCILKKYQGALAVWNNSFHGIS